jgi:RHS repeat-associated protein
MPGRNFNAVKYRFGFNAKEMDDEVKGMGNSVDFGARIYDSRLITFLSIDPLALHFPHVSPYQFAANNPIYNLEMDGQSGLSFLQYLFKVIFGFKSSPKTAEEAQEDAETRTAIVKTEIGIKKIAEANDETIFNWVPGMSSIENLKNGNHKTAGLLLIADLFGGKLVGGIVKNIGLRAHIMKVFVNQKLSGAGIDELVKVASKVDNLAKQLSDETVTGAAKEILGIPIENPKLNPLSDGHVKKVRQGLQGLVNTIDEIRSKIQKGIFTDEVAQEAERVAKALQKEKDRIVNQLNRAIKKANNK